LDLQPKIMTSKPTANADLFFRRRTPAQQQADSRFSKACDELAIALDIERHHPTPENRKARRAAEKAWEAARQARDQARMVSSQSGLRFH
jgi:hypothetical protein